MNNNEQQIFEQTMSRYYEARRKRADGGSGQDAASAYEDVIMTLKSQVIRLLDRERLVVAHHIDTVNM